MAGADTYPERHALELGGVSHRFGATLALDDVSLAVRPGEFVVFLGPSGCGKTTLLRMISGFIRPETGAISLDGRRVERLAPEERGVGIVFQSYALFPHLNVARNVGYGLRARRIPKTQHAGLIRDMLRLVRMEGFAERYPRQLSGGQQQRVALARALAIAPAILLLDEPFAALDKNLRLDMQVELKRIQRDAGITTIMVTHDQEEALSLADRIAVFSGGRLEQFGTPEEVYDEPASAFVSGFVGRTNFLPGSLAQDGTGLRIDLAAGAVLRVPRARPCGRLGPVVVSVRPENLRLCDGDGVLAGTVHAVISRGATIAYDVAITGGELVRVVEMRGSRPAVAPGTAVRLDVAAPERCPVYLA